jgi:hypothetical protein
VQGDEFPVAGGPLHWIGGEPSAIPEPSKPPTLVTSPLPVPPRWTLAIPFAAAWAAGTSMNAATVAMRMARRVRPEGKLVPRPLGLRSFDLEDVAFEWRLT